MAAPPAQVPWCPHCRKPLPIEKLGVARRRGFLPVASYVYCTNCGAILGGAYT